MRKIVVLALAAAALAACASDRDRQVAAIRCQEVGITPSSAEYAPCTQAYMRQAHEGALEASYDELIDPTHYIVNQGRRWH
jgi:hypothetical protein